MHADPSIPQKHRQRWRPQQQQQSSSTATTATTTLLPFRRRGRGVDVAAVLSPLHAYLQPQWAVPQLEQSWTAPQLPSREALQKQPQPQPQPQRGAWANMDATAAASHAYFIDNNFASPSTQLYGPLLYRGEPAPPPPASVCVSTVEAARRASRSPPLLEDDASSAVPPSSRQPPFAAAPFALDAAVAPVTSPGGGNAARRDSVEQKRSGRTTRVDSSTASRSSAVRQSRGRGITEIRPGCTTSTERVRYRNSVTKKLIDLYDEVAELYECRENVYFQVTQAMRSDPRYTKERHGEVRLAYKPTPPQQAAVKAVGDALETLYDACHELVAAYLTPEEKRYLGIDTHVFQTSAEKTSTYQYVPTTPPSKSTLLQLPPQHKEKSGGGTVPLRSASAASSSSSGSPHPQHPPRQGAPTEQDTNASKFVPQPTSTPSFSLSSAPYQSAAHTGTTPHISSPALNNNHRGVQLDTSADPQMSSQLDASPIVVPPTAKASVKDSDAAPMQPPQSQTLPMTVETQPIALQPPAVDTEAEDTVAVGSVSSPEKMYAPALSASSLGGGAWPSDTTSATARASSGAPRAPQNPPLLVKVPMQSPPPSTAAVVVARTSSPASKWPPGVPPNAKLVKMPVGRVPPPAATASHPPTHPSSRTTSFTNRTTPTVAPPPHAPGTRAEFKRFLIDSDSDSTAV